MCTSYIALLRIAQVCGDRRPNQYSPNLYIYPLNKCVLYPLPRIPNSLYPLSSVRHVFCVQWISGTESRIIKLLVSKRPGKKSEIKNHLKYLDAGNLSQIKDKNKKYLKQNMKKYIFKKNLTKN